MRASRPRWLSTGQPGVALLVAIAGVCGVRPALAQAVATSSPPDSRPIAIHVDAPAACPEHATARILERASGVHLARAGERAPRLLVRVIAHEGWYVGAIAVDDASGRRVIRQVDGGRCDEVLGALVLIAALTLDAPRPTQPTPDAASTGPAPPTTPAPWPVWQPPPIGPPPTEPEAPLRVGVGVGFGVAGGLAPHVIPGGTLIAEIGVPGDAPIGVVRAGAGYWASPEVSASTIDAGATYRAVLARVEGCVVALRRDPAWAAPCATLDLGSLTGEGVVGGAVDTAAARSVLWAAPGPAVRAGLELVGPLAVAVEGALTFPLSRDAFVFEDPAAVAHEVPPAALRTGVELGVLFR